MKINVAKNSSLSRTNSVIRTGTQTLSKGRNFLEKNTDNAFRGDEANKKEKVGGLSINPRPFLNRKERKAWEKLSAAKQEKFMEKGYAKAAIRKPPSYIGQKKKEPVGTHSIHSVPSHEVSLGGNVSPSANPRVTPKVSQTGGNLQANISGQSAVNTSVGATAKVGAGTTKATAVATKGVATGVTTGATTGTKIAAGAAAGVATKGVGFVAVSAVVASKKTAEAFQEFFYSSSAIRGGGGGKALGRIDQAASSMQEYGENLKQSGKVPGIIKGTVIVAAAAILMAGKALVASFLASLIPILAVLVITFAVFIGAISLLTALFGSHQAGRGSALAFVQVAEEQYANAEANRGGFVYKDWFGMNADWCAIFTSWVANEVGLIDANVIYRSAGVIPKANFFRERGEFFTREGFQPQKGDLAFWDWRQNGILSHINIVVEVDEEARTFITVGGNEGSSSTTPFHLGSEVRRLTWSMDSPRLYGFGRPSFPSTTLHGGTYTEQIFNAFVDMGYSRAAAAAMVGNIFRETGTLPNGDINIHAVEGPHPRGVGLIQWSYGRRIDFENFARSQGSPWPNTSLEVQLDFLFMELNSAHWPSAPSNYARRNYPATALVSHQEFMRLTCVETATLALCAMFIRPAFSTAACGYRIRRAWEAYNSFN